MGELRVVAAAIRVGKIVMSVPQPGRHGTIINYLHAIGKGDYDRTGEGFLLSDGTFADRVEALKIAKAAGQYQVHLGPDAYYSGSHYGKHLFSEDLW